MVKAAESVPARGAQKLINLGYVVCDALATDVLSGHGPARRRA